MKDATLQIAVQTAVEQGWPTFTIWTPQGWQAPKGFPRRELLCCPSEGGRTWRVDSLRLLAWLSAGQQPKETMK